MNQRDKTYFKDRAAYVKGTFAYWSRKSGLNPPP